MTKYIKLNRNQRRVPKGNIIKHTCGMKPRQYNRWLEAEEIGPYLRQKSGSLGDQELAMQAAGEHEFPDLFQALKETGWYEQGGET